MHVIFSPDLVCRKLAKLKKKKRQIMELYHYYTPTYLSAVTRVIKSFKDHSDKIFSEMFLENFYDDNYTGNIMKQWTVLSKKVDKWLNSFFYPLDEEQINGICLTYNKEELENSLEELFECFNQTFKAFSKFSFFK